MAAKDRHFFFITLFASVLLLAGLVIPVTAFDGKLLVAVGQEPTEMDQNLAASGASHILVGNWGEYLLQRSPDGDLKPGLATSWKFSPDGKEVLFTLRQGVKFHSGDEFTAKDVEFSIKRGLEKSSAVRILLRTFEKSEVIDDYHIKFHFKEPSNTFMQKLGVVGIISKAYYDKVGEEEHLKKPVGTGPYKVVEYKPGEYFDIERFEGYWGPKPSIKAARVFFVPEDTTRVAKLQAGEVDMIQSVPWGLVNNLKKDKAIKLIKSEPNHPTRSIIFHTKNPKVPWYDRRVRVAIAHALDREAIVRDLLYGIPNTYGIIAPGQIGYNPAVKPWTYDPDMAKKLLAEAGYPNGFDMDLYWAISGRVPMSSEVVQAVAAQLSVVGIRVKLVGEEYETFRRRRSAAIKSPDAVFVAYYAGGLTGEANPSNSLNYYYSSKFNIYANPEMDKLAAEATAELDDDKCAEIIKKAVNIIYEDAPTIPIFNSVDVWAMKTNIDFNPTKKAMFDYLYFKDVTAK